MPPSAPLETPGARFRSATAFTLLELLIVIAVVAVVMALSLPTLAKVREMGNNSKCVGNLRAISSGLFAYIADHDGDLPLCAALPNDRYRNSGPYRKGTFWFDALNPYMGYPGYAPDRQEAFPSASATDTEFPFPWQQCPAKKFFPLERQMVGYGWNSLNFGHDMTRAEKVGYAESGFGSNIRQMVDLARTIIIADSVDAADGRDADSFKNRYIYDPSIEKRYPYPQRHAGKANYLFLDGHVEAFAPEFFKTAQAPELFKLKRP